MGGEGQCGRTLDPCTGQHRRVRALDAPMPMAERCTRGDLGGRDRHVPASGGLPGALNGFDLAAGRKLSPAEEVDIN
jgi:hypothetical protein